MPRVEGGGEVELEKAVRRGFREEGAGFGDAVAAKEQSRGFVVEVRAARRGREGLVEGGDSLFEAAGGVSKELGRTDAAAKGRTSGFGEM
ncbi:MAG: hypothetical protein SFV54_05180 [Bryobacteraceae bacterium]|nr:hypothetical protein [Bryobacteraceae bacterium]